MPQASRRILRKIAAAALCGADAGAAVRRSLDRDGSRVLVEGRPLPLAAHGRAIVLAVGKASVPMLAAAQTVLGDRIARAVLVAPPGTHSLPGIPCYEAGHPLPDQGSLAAAAAAMDLASAARRGDVFLFLLSGGASAMLEHPVDGMSLGDLRATTDALLRSGATIQEINLVRRALSTLKGGGLADLAAPAFVQTIAVSDVVGDDPAVIGSGPTVASSQSWRDAALILGDLAMPEEDRARLVALLRRAELAPGRAGALGPGTTTKTAYAVVASVRDAIDAAAREAVGLGFAVEIAGAEVIGEARTVGRAWARAAMAPSGGSLRCCRLAGGETTVSVVGDGRGGRNQEFTLAAALELDGAPDVAVAALATDGQDGPTDAAGAMADGVSAARGRALGCDARGFLEANDSYTFFAKLNDLLVTGPSLTNVMDLHIALTGVADD